MISLHDTTCPCCGDDNVRQLGKLPDSNWFAGKHLEHALPGGNLYRCHSCQLKFRYPVQDPATYHLLYDNAAITTWSADATRPDWNLIIGCVREHLPLGGRVLDFGCYSGGLLTQLGSDYERYGVEINNAAATAASEVLHGRIWPTADDIPKDSRFDAIIVADVIEHMANPMQFIEKLTTLLTDRGIIIITTGDADNFLWDRFGANWWYCFYPEHISFLSASWLNFLSMATGLSVVRCDTFHYRERSSVAETFFACFYGLFPSIYLRLGSLLNKLTGHPSMTSVPGNGVSADHLFIVLTRKVDS